MRLTVVGSGDAFGSGGRANTCFWLESADTTVALDFGVTSLVELKRRGLDSSRLDAVVLSHLHGDHFGGLPFLLLDAQFNSRREKPLTIVGPVGTQDRLRAAQEVLFPGSSGTRWRYPLEIVELPCGTPRRIADLDIVSREVKHPAGAPSTGVRLSDGRSTLAYSGDTSWTEALFEIAREADLFIVECYTMTGAPPAHLDFETIQANRGRLGARRVMLTHMSAAMLDRLAEIEGEDYVLAQDGLVLAL